MRGTRAFGGRLGSDDRAAVDPPRAVLGRQHRLAMFADVDGVLDVERPVAAGPPDDSSRFQVVAGQDSHAISFKELATPGAPRQSSASARAATLPPMISAGLCTLSRATRSPRSVTSVRSTRAPLGGPASEDRRVGK